MEFKKLSTEPENKGIKGLVKSAHFRKSVIYILVGGVAGFLFYYFTDGQQMDEMIFQGSIPSILLGAFLGFFITNSPCARNKC